MKGTVVRMEGDKVKGAVNYSICGVAAGTRGRDGVAKAICPR
jgi:hypothetical protein